MPRKAKKKRRPRVVIDTSVLVSGIAGFREPFAVGRNPSADLLRKWAEKENFVWLVSGDILAEYKEILKRRRVRPHTIGRVINLIQERAEQIDVRVPAGISPDPKDDPFCACAEEGQADFIVTLNPRDFPQELLKARVVPPSQLLR